MKHHNFTDIQTKRIFELVNQLNETNESLASNIKIQGIEFFSDKNRNFMCSYSRISYDDGKLTCDIKFVLINGKGEVADATEHYGSEDMAFKKCQEMFKIKLA